MDLSQFLTGGAATRADSLSGLNPQFQNALASMFAAAPAGLQIKSGYRSPELQAQLWDQALAKYGSPQAARKWVAPPGHSKHGDGDAADLAFANPAALTWAHDNAPQFGLNFPLSNENWHIELAGARGVSPSAAPAPDLHAAMTSVMPTAAPMGGAPGGMLLGDIAAQYLAGQQQRMEIRRAEQEAEDARRAALLGGGLFS